MRGIKENEKQVMGLVASKKEGGDNPHDWELTIDIRSNFLMEDGVVRPTKIGITIRGEVMLSLLRSAQDIQKMVKCFMKTYLRVNHQRKERSRMKNHKLIKMTLEIFSQNGQI